MSRLDVRMEILEKDNGDNILKAKYKKTAPGIVRVITFTFGDDLNPIIIQKGTLIGQQEFTFDLLNNVTGDESITVISYGTIGRNPIIEFGSEFEQSDKVFAIWNTRKVLRRN